MTPEELKAEEDRHAIVSLYHVLDTPPAEDDFDKLTRMASKLCNAPISLISFVNGGREWVRAATGITPPEASPLENSFCIVAMRSSDLLVVPDAARDARFCNHPFVKAGIRFYAGKAIINEEGYALGALCVADTEVRSFAPPKRRILTMIANCVAQELDLRRKQQEASVLKSDVLQWEIERLSEQQEDLKEDILGYYQRAVLSYKPAPAV